MVGGGSGGWDGEKSVFDLRREETKTERDVDCHGPYTRPWRVSTPPSLTRE